jgi:hypothetical protein
MSNFYVDLWYINEFMITQDQDQLIAGSCQKTERPSIDRITMSVMSSLASQLQ